MMRLTVVLFLLAVGSAKADASLAGDSAAGQALAEQIRNSLPEESTQISGTIVIRADGKTRTEPLVCRVVIRDTSWESVYEVGANTNSGAEHLVVVHGSNAPNEYLYASAPAPSAPLPKATPISAATAAATALGGSDFSAADLGLDFLHWPQQRQLRGEMRLGQPCYVLDSRDPQAAGIVRVKSYIDKETHGLLIAEGYDAQDHLVKEFSLHSSSFKKVNGHWRLEKMEIRDVIKHSRTEIKFDIVD